MGASRRWSTGGSARLRLPGGALILAEAIWRAALRRPGGSSAPEARSAVKLCGGVVWPECGPAPTGEATRW
ncbi:pollen-specific leucine-rich repeat extensin-like protein 3 [Iris pallida]|uniref:Pollen-specific leucine-rich repeat extensin-like protein 3 n=1 Tax=Iris pallida TaxID=29817 RepID=A0AAX6FMI0_IRIPA|nr:pollen-specific leucine-rich repeat extensin-like protein 3 [Iris pallida]